MELEKFLRENRSVGRKEDGVEDVRRVLKGKVLENGVNGIRGRLKSGVMRVRSLSVREGNGKSLKRREGIRRVSTV